MDKEAKNRRNFRSKMHELRRRVRDGGVISSHNMQLLRAYEDRAEEAMSKLRPDTPYERVTVRTSALSDPAQASLEPKSGPSETKNEFEVSPSPPPTETPCASPGASETPLGASGQEAGTGGATAAQDAQQAPSEPPPQPEPKPEPNAAPGAAQGASAWSYVPPAGKGGTIPGFDGKVMAALITAALKSQSEEIRKAGQTALPDLYWDMMFQPMLASWLDEQGIDMRKLRFPICAAGAGFTVVQRVRVGVTRAREKAAEAEAKPAENKPQGNGVKPTQQAASQVPGGSGGSEVKPGTF